MFYRLTDGQIDTLVDIDITEIENSCLCTGVKGFMCGWCTYMLSLRGCYT